MSIEENKKLVRRYCEEVADHWRVLWAHAPTPKELVSSLLLKVFHFKCRIVRLATGSARTLLPAPALSDRRHFLLCSPGVIEDRVNVGGCGGRARRGEDAGDHRGADVRAHHLRDLRTVAQGSIPRGEGEAGGGRSYPLLGGPSDHHEADAPMPRGEDHRRGVGCDAFSRPTAWRVRPVFLLRRRGFLMYATHPYRT